MTTLPTTRLGRTGMHVTRVGFGAWAIGGGDWAFAWGNQDDAASVAAIRHAVESGINWIDTAAVYGLGHSEEVVAAALAGLPEADRPYVFTKGGLVWDPADRSAAPRRVGAPASIRTEVEASLRRLRVERIDLYQMHWPAEDGTPLEEYWQVFTDLKREGKIRAAGLSNHGIFQLEAAEGIGAVDAIQPPFNLIHRDAADDVLLWAREHEAGAIVYSPMASGLLTGAFTAARAARLQPGDWRAGHPDFTEPALSANLALAAGAAPGRRTARRHARRGGRRLDAGLPRGDRRDRRRAQPPSGRRVAARREPGAEGRRPVRHRRRHPRHRGRDRARVALARVRLRALPESACGRQTPRSEDLSPERAVASRLGKHAAPAALLDQAGDRLRLRQTESPASVAATVAPTRSAGAR